MIGIWSTHNLLDLRMPRVNKLTLNFEFISRQRSWTSAWLQTKVCKLLHFHVHQKTLISSCWFCWFPQNWASSLIKRPLLAEETIYFCAMELRKKPKYLISWLNTATMFFSLYWLRSVMSKNFICENKMNRILQAKVSSDRIH